MSGTFTLAGTGGSMGVPVIGCKCEVCLSDNPRNKRLRCACFLESQGKKIWIDAGPDFRAQALKLNIDHLDALFFTHAHQDHVAGIDDLRPLFFERKSPLPCYLSKTTYDDLHARFPYIFSPTKKEGILLPKLETRFLGERGHGSFEGVRYSYMSYEQAGMKVTGFRFGNLAYLTDICKYPETIFEDLDGIETLVVSALRFTPSNIHFTVDEAIDFARKTGAKQTWLTHLAHELDYDKLNAYLPPDIRAAYDGLQLQF